MRSLNINFLKPKEIIITFVIHSQQAYKKHLLHWQESFNSQYPQEANQIIKVQ